MNADVAIISPIEVEYLAVRSYLNALEETIKEGSIYETGKFSGKHKDYQVVIRQTGSKNTDIALAIDRIIRCFNPAIVLLVGIAGGVKDVTIGDIVVATKAYGYDFGKAVGDYLATRPESIPYDTELIDQARSVTRQASWQQKVLHFKKVPKVVFGPIASGEKVIASTQSPEYALLKRNFNDTTALEMESIGFAKAAFPYKNIRIMNIRGISDLLDNKSATDAEGSQEMAAEHAAVFTFALLENLDFKHFTTNNFMENKNNIQDSKNVVTGNINANGNVHIGDIHIQQNTPGNTPSNPQFNNTITGEIRKLISNNKIKPAIEQLLQLTNGKDEDLYTQVNQLSKQWKKLQQQENLGIITFSEANTISNQITYNLLTIINELEA